MCTSSLETLGEGKYDESRSKAGRRLDSLLNGRSSGCPIMKSCKEVFPTGRQTVCSE